MLHDGPFRLDGGAMFGVVPRPLWEKLTPPTSAIAFSWRCGRCSSRRPGAGCSSTAARATRWARSRWTSTRSIAAAPSITRSRRWAHVGVDRLRAGHAPALRSLRWRNDAGDGALRPRFGKARYLIRDAEWEDATHPHERNRASYLQEDFVPLKAAGVVDFFSGDSVIRPGVRVERTGGHTGQHQIVYLESGGKTAVFVADMIPTTAHLQDPWVMGYDLFPMDTLAFKKRFIREAIDREYLIFFEHDPIVAAGYIREKGTARDSSSRCSVDRSPKTEETGD